MNDAKVTIRPLSNGFVLDNNEDGEYYIKNLAEVFRQLFLFYTEIAEVSSEDYNVILHQMEELVDSKYTMGYPLAEWK
jgi:hypothetical protein